MKNSQKDMIIGIISQIMNFKSLNRLFLSSLFAVQNLQKFYALHKQNIESILPIYSIINESIYLSLCMFKEGIYSKYPLNNTV
jgi:hypothetical protein